MTKIQNESSIDEAKRLLDAHPDFKVIRRISPRTAFAESDGRTLSKGIVVDTETTGTNPDKDALIELGMVLLHYFRYFVRVNVMKLEGVMTAKKSVTSLKGLVKKPESQVTIAMMNEATTVHRVKKDQPKVDRKPSY